MTRDLATDAPSHRYQQDRKTLAEWDPLVFRLIRGRVDALSFEDREELVADCRMAILTAVETWKSDGGSTLKTFVSTAIRRTIRDRLRGLYASKRWPPADSLNAPDAYGGERLDYIEGRDEWEKTERKIVAESLIKFVPAELDRQILELALSGTPVREIAQVVGISRQRVFQRMDSLDEKIRLDRCRRNAARALGR